MLKAIGYVLGVCVLGACLSLTACTDSGTGTKAADSTTVVPAAAPSTVAAATNDTVNGVTTAGFQDSITPAQVLEKFKEGNRRFLAGKVLHRNYLSQVGVAARGQHPYAVIVSCIDSRIPTEIIFDKGIGDMFNARIAGNFINTDILGSLEFACKVSGAKLILIMGHSDCGAIKSACDDVKLGNITSMLANITPAVRAIKGFEGQRNSKNKEFVGAVARENVLMAKDKILKESPILRDMVAKGEVLIAGAMYNLQDGSVQFYP